MLVCSLVGLGSEEVKQFRRAVKKIGFSCQMESGKFLLRPNSGSSDWFFLFKLLDIEKGCIPLYFVYGDRQLTVDYGKYCAKFAVNAGFNQIFLAGWRGLLLGRLRMSMAVLNIKKIEKDGNN